MIFPEDFVERIKSQAGIESSVLLQALKEPSPVSIRINRARWNMEPAVSIRVPWCPDGWYLTKRPSFTLDPLFHSGCYYPQEASGMFVGEAYRQVMGGRTDIRVLDLCGAPGGKSTHLSSLIGKSGMLIANEVIRSRASILAGSVTRWGKGNTIVTNSDPAAFSRMEGYFDLILVDAPCSGEGMFRDEVALREWSLSNTALCSERQKRIVMDVWPSLKKGGYMIYSTCTFNPAENEENIRWLIDTCQGESVRIDIREFKGIREIDYKGIKGYGFYPGKVSGEGFFLSVIRKDEGSAASGLGRSGQSAKKVMKEDRSVAQKLLKMEVPLILREKEDVFAVPVMAEEYTMLRQKLNIVKKGTLLYQVKRDDIIPSHELALSELLSADAFPVVGLEYRNAISFLRKENLMLKDLPEGWVIAGYRGINLGFIKNIRSRINNYFPVGWRIRMPAEREVADIIEWKKVND
jgi:16S rRNA C967 or C1407 C5-methylase (RsmB/RsmF family)/NOL1/NOP2/fmu family ribosome biogenesis protein